MLISQIVRSGGTLLAQLLDGHEQLHCHPPECLIGGGTWPDLDLSQPAKVLFKALRERHLRRAFLDGYYKDKPARTLGLEVSKAFPLDLDPDAHRALFLDLCRQDFPATTRAALNHYFTALFNAWAGNRSLDGDKRWTVVFRNKLGQGAQLDRFFQLYPEGRYLTCTRAPKARTASCIRYRGVLRASLPRYIDEWRALSEHQLSALDRFPGQVALVRMEALVQATEPTMRRLSGWLDIRYDPILIRPTFNRDDIRANSSFSVESHGVISAPLDNWRAVLTDDEAAEIDARTSDLQSELVRRATA